MLSLTPSQCAESNSESSFLNAVSPSPSASPTNFDAAADEHTLAAYRPPKQILKARPGKRTSRTREQENINHDWKSSPVPPSSYLVSHEHRANSRIGHIASSHLNLAIASSGKVYNFVIKCLSHKLDVLDLWQFFTIQQKSRAEGNREIYTRRLWISRI